MPIALKLFGLLLLTVILVNAYPCLRTALAETLNTEISAADSWQFPRVESDSNADAYTLYRHKPLDGEPVLRIVRWNGSTWLEHATITAADLALIGRNFISFDNLSRVDFVIDSSDRIHVVFPAGNGNLSRSQDTIHGIFDGNWSFTLIVDETNIAENISIFIDGNNRLHMAYTIDGLYSGGGRNYILKYATNVSDNWTTREIIETDNRSTDELHDTHITVDGNGVVTILYRREDNQNTGYDSYYATSSADTFSDQTKIIDGVADNAVYRLAGAALDGTTLHYAYNDLTNTAAYHCRGVDSICSTTAITDTDSAADITLSSGTIAILAETGGQYRWKTSSNGGTSWHDTGDQFALQGQFNDSSVSSFAPFVFMVVAEDQGGWTASSLATQVNSDGILTAAAGVEEPVAIPTTANSGAPVDIFDFTITDQGTSDLLPILISEIRLSLAGTALASFAKLRFNLSGCATLNGIAPDNGLLTFAVPSLAVADGSDIDCTIQAYWATAGGVVDNQSVSLSINGATDLTVSSTRTLMSPANSTVYTGAMTTEVNATRLVFTTQPGGSVSGSPLTTQPVVAATDSFDNIDKDFSALVTLNGTPGSLVNNSVAADSGIAAFSNLIYLATADKETYSLTADTAGSLNQATSITGTAEVVATKLLFTSEPGGAISGRALSTQPVIAAVDANSIRDVDFTETVTLSEASPGALTGATATAIAGSAAFSTLTYSATEDQETFILTANDEDSTGSDLSSVTSGEVITDVVATRLVFSVQPAPLSVISGATRDFTADPLVSAVDDNGLVDHGFTDTVVMTETGPGSAVFTNSSTKAAAGVATFSGLTLTYTALSAPENLTLLAKDQNDGANIEGDLAAVESNSLTAVELPQPPSVPDLHPGSDSGSSNSDNTTFVTTPVFTGTAASGTLVTLSSSLVGPVGSSSTNGSGLWSITSSTLGEGLHSLTATAADLIGASQPSPPLLVIIDTTPPTPASAPALLPSSDSGISNNDNVTNVQTPGFSGQGEVGSIVTLDSSIQGESGAGSVDAEGKYNLTALPLSEGNHDLTVTARDAAGNEAAPSPLLMVTIDITAPDAPSQPDLTASSDSGISNSDNRTNVITPIFIGEAEIDTGIDLFSDGLGSTGSTITDGTGTWAITTAPLNNGTHTIFAVAVDPAGNLSLPSASLPLIVDTLPPVIDNLPADIRITTVKKNDSTAQVSWTEPTASDNIDGPVTLAQTAGLTSGSSFPLGPTTITYTAGDNQGNITVESFTVEVISSHFPWWILMPGLVAPEKNILPPVLQYTDGQ